MAEPSRESAGHFTITRSFSVSRDVVWRAWVEEAELAQWLRPFGVSADSVVFDVRVGGQGSGFRVVEGGRSCI